jgi:hypothetical protein
MPKSQRELALAVVKGLRKLKEAVRAGQIDLESRNFRRIMVLLERWDHLQTTRGFVSIMNAGTVTRRVFRAAARNRSKPAR